MEKIGNSRKMVNFWFKNGKIYIIKILKYFYDFLLDVEK